MSDDQFFIPVSAMEMPRCAGMPSFMRLPHLEMGSSRIDEVEMGRGGVGRGADGAWDHAPINVAPLQAACAECAAFPRPHVDAAALW